MLLVTATLTAVTAVPAHAGPAHAMRRCAEGQVANHDIPHLLVWGNGGGGVPVGRNPGNFIEPGDVFQIVPDMSSRVDPDDWEGGSLGPGGNGQAAPRGWPFPGLAQYPAVLRFNNNPAGWVGDPVQATALGGCMLWADALPVRLLFGVTTPICPTTPDSGASVCGYTAAIRACLRRLGWPVVDGNDVKTVAFEGRVCRIGGYTSATFSPIVTK
ncbi:hypothetical protein [Nonomuraea sp. JJY05]|uniref:hypothetical protein n=1 Tax=Nonomuraea sp. JJY05 TaxID=3350255 RepID=UPI00373F2590